MSTSVSAITGEVTRRHRGSQDPAFVVVANAYQHAVVTLQQDLRSQGADCAWIGQSTSMGDVLRVVDQARQAHDNRKWEDSKRMKWINEFASSITSYNAVLGTLAAADPVYASLVWGAIRFLLEAVMGYSHLVVQFAKSCAQIGKALSGAGELIATYNTSWMQAAVSHLYVTILSFLCRAVKWYTREKFKRFISSALQPPKIPLQDTIDEINKCVDKASREADAAAYAQSSDIFLMSEQQKLVQLQSEQLLRRIDHGLMKLLQHTVGNEPAAYITTSSASLGRLTQIEAEPPAPLAVASDPTLSLHAEQSVPVDQGPHGRESAREAMRASRRSVSNPTTATSRNSVVSIPLTLRTSTPTPGSLDSSDGRNTSFDDPELGLTVSVSKPVSFWSSAMSKLLEEPRKKPWMFGFTGIAAITGIVVLVQKT